MPVTATVTDSANVTGTGFTATLTAGYTADDYLILAINSNQARTYTFGSNVIGVPIVNSGNRVHAYRIIPNTLGETSFTVAPNTGSAVYQWEIIKVSGADNSALIATSTAASGTNTSSILTTPTIDLPYVATGDELAICIAGVNSTATWTTTVNTIFNTTSGNAATMINARNAIADHITVAFEDLDRGLGGTNRIEASVGLVIQPVQTPTPTLLTNGSYEVASGSGVAVGWETEGNTNNSVTYSLSTDYNTDAVYTQRVQYTGHASDNGQFLAFYQAPIAAAPGDTLTLSVDAAGTKDNCVLVAGIEDFLEGGAYISETDVLIDELTTTPTTYTVTHTCQPGTDYVAVYIQFNEIYTNAQIDAYFDRAFLYHNTAGGNIKVYDGSIFTAKPIKVYNGSTWEVKPLKVYNGLEWTETGY